MLQILHFVPALDGGGIERLLYNYYVNMNHEKVHFDFALHTKEKGILGEKFLDLDSKLFYITPKRKSLYKYVRDFSRIIKNNNYDVIHVHQNFVSWIPIFIAKIFGCKIRIVHSHNCVLNEKLYTKIYHWFSRKLILNYSTNYFACGEEAAKWLYGNKMVNKGKVMILKNAVNLDQFNYDKNVRKKLRDEFEIRDKFCIGHVGRFSNQKNHEFLIEIFSEIYKKDKDTILMLVGTGELIGDIKEKVKVMGLEHAVLFLGVRNDVNKLYNAMDIFVLPSYHEGLPVSLIEAQSAGLLSIVSDRVDKGSDITNTIDFVSINKSCQDWANLILDKKRKYKRCNNYEKITNTGFNIKNEAKKLELFYKQFEGV